MITATVTGGAIQLTGNPVIVDCTGASIPSGAYEYMVLLRTISEDGKLSGAPFVDSISPDSNGAAKFDISGILDQLLEVSFQYPATQKYIAHPTQAFNVQVQPGERYIDSSGLLVENWFAVSDIFQMLKGGLSPRQNAMMKAAAETFYSKYIQSGKFLTLRPMSDYVHPTQPVKLWFIPHSNLSSTLAVTAYYSDGTSDTKSSSIFLNTDYLYELNVNPALHSLPLQPAYNKKILYFDVWLHYNGSLLSDVRRFEVDWRYCERPYFLFFANSLGGIDDVYLDGFAVDSFGITSSMAYRPVRPDDTVYTPTILSSDKSGQNKWKINSGWKSISIIQFYRDLMLSKQAWFLYPNINGTSLIIVPVIIQNTDIELINRQDDQFSIDIELIEAHTSRFSFDNRLY